MSVILTKSETADLNIGPRYKQSVKAHERVIIYRAEQSLKDRKIEDFAVSFLSQCDRYGITAADQRHAVNLFNLFRVKGVMPEKLTTLHLRRA